MTKIAIITDTHSGIKNDSVFFYDYFKKCFKWFFAELDSRQIKDVIHLGDVYDRRKYINFHTAHKTRIDFFEPLVERNINTHIISGNHDIYFKNTNHINALDELISGRYNNIKTYNAPYLLDYDGTLIQLIPWILESNSTLSYDTISSTKAEILMGHFEMKEFEYIKGIKSDHGDAIDIFNRFDMVLSGHYHHRSKVNNFHYLGAFAEYTWSDYNDSRGFSILDTETRHIEFIKNPNSIFKMISYNDINHIDILNTIRDKDYSEYKDCYVRIVSVNRTNSYAFDFLLDKLYKVSPLDISIIEDVTQINEMLENNNYIDSFQDTSSILNSYIDNLSLPVKTDEMKTYMKDVYKEALSI